MLPAWGLLQPNVSEPLGGEEVSFPWWRDTEFPCWAPEASCSCLSPQIVFIIVVVTHELLVIKWALLCHEENWVDWRKLENYMIYMLLETVLKSGFRIMKICMAFAKAPICQWLLFSQHMHRFETQVKLPVSLSDLGLGLRVKNDEAAHFEK